MYRLLGNNVILEELKTKEECEISEAEYKEIEEAMYNKNTINFKIERIEK